jgi:drug/metabolite transporter (DMT)-like permease
MVAHTVLWVLYFVTSVLGYVGMKFAAEAMRGLPSDLSSLWRPFIHPWGIVAMGAWLVSGIVWPWILSRDTLAWANALSSLRIVLIAMAAAYIVGEVVTARQWMGALFILVGVALSK